MRISLVVVAHRSAEVLADCLASFRAEAAAAGVEPDVVVVDHSEDPAEVIALEGMKIDRLLVRPNRGYAAGVNVGVAAAGGEVILIANADVELLPGSLAGLLRGLEAGFTVVGPQLVWDRDGRVFLPVPEDPSPGAELGRLRRLHNQAAWERWLTRAVDEMWDLWQADSCVEVAALRGPVLAVRRHDFLRLGPLDEGYFLYFEETEWLWRARRRGARLGFAGDARVLHHWAHSTRRLDRAGEIEAASRRRFLRRNFGLPARCLRRLALRRVREVGPAAEIIEPPEALPIADADLWLLSFYPHFLPAAGWLSGGTLPRVVVERTARGEWWLAALVGGRGAWRLAGAWRWGTA